MLTVHSFVSRGCETLAVHTAHGPGRVLLSYLQVSGAASSPPHICYAQPKCPVWCFPKETDTGHERALLFACLPALRAVSARTSPPLAQR